MTTTPDRIGAWADDFYTTLIAAHEGLSDTESAAMNARLILLMANEIGDFDRITDLIARARPG